MRGVESWMLIHWGAHHLGEVIGRWLGSGRALRCWILIGPALIRGHWGGWVVCWILIVWAAVPSSPPSPGLLGLWRGKRSSWRCTGNGGCRGIFKVHNGAARCRRRGVVNPIHVAFIQGLGYRYHGQYCSSSLFHLYLSPSLLVFLTLPSPVILVYCLLQDGW